MPKRPDPDHPVTVTVMGDGMIHVTEAEYIWRVLLADGSTVDVVATHLTGSIRQAILNHVRKDFAGLESYVCIGRSTQMTLSG